jgi:hypothetical protein
MRRISLSLKLRAPSCWAEYDRTGQAGRLRISRMLAIYYAKNKFEFEAESSELFMFA